MDNNHYNTINIKPHNSGQISIIATLYFKQLTLLIIHLTRTKSRHVFVPAGSSVAQAPADSPAASHVILLASVWER